MSLTLIYLSYEFIKTVREHQHFREFLLKNAALDYLPIDIIKHNLKILERKYFKDQ